MTEALAMINSDGVLHRDITPANILLAPNGPRIIDFGIAKPVDARGPKTDGVIGTEPYLAPERVDGAQAGEATEVWSVAAVVHYALTATAPRRAHPDALRGFSPDFRQMLETCLSELPSRRPPLQRVLHWATDGRSASALVYDHWLPPAALQLVNQLKNEVAVIERSAGATPETDRPRHRRRPLLAVAVVGSVVIGGGWLAFDQDLLSNPRAAAPARPAASLPAATCDYEVRQGKGLKQLPYRCEVTYVNGTVPVFRAPEATATPWASLKESSGEQWFACHVRGETFTGNDRTSTWWARTQSDSNADRWGYVPEVFLTRVTDNPAAMAVCS